MTKNFYNIQYYACCLSCEQKGGLIKVVISNDIIENPSNSQLMELINYGHDATCPSCGVEGNFDIEMIVFEDLYFEPLEVPSDGSLGIEMIKKNGALDNINLRASFQNPKKVDILNSITIVLQHMAKLKEDYDNGSSSTNHFVKDDNGSLYFTVQLNESPPYITPWQATNYGFSYDEATDELENLRDQYKI